MTRALTPSQENYLEHIHRLSAGGPVRVREIAEAAGVRLPSVTRAVARLREAGLVRHQAYGVVEITPKGIDAAKAVIRRDDCLQELLEGILGMDPEAARSEVCRLEHVVGSEVLARLEVLVAHAAAPGSTSWRAALARKLRRLRDGASGEPGPDVGAANLHAGP